MYVQPIHNAADDGMRGAGGNILKGAFDGLTAWTESDGYQWDGGDFSTEAEKFISLPMLTTVSGTNFTRFLIGRRASNEIVVGIYGDDEPDERGVRILFL